MPGTTRRLIDFVEDYKFLHILLNLLIPFQVHLLPLFKVLPLLQGLLNTIAISGISVVVSGTTVQWIAPFNTAYTMRLTCDSHTL